MLDSNVVLNQYYREWFKSSSLILIAVFNFSIIGTVRKWGRADFDR